MARSENDDGAFSSYNDYYLSQPVKLSFPVASFFINIRGAYGFEDIVRHLQKQISEKKIFFAAYFTLTATLSLSTLILIALNYKKRELL